MRRSRSRGRGSSVSLPRGFLQRRPAVVSRRSDFAAGGLPVDFGQQLVLDERFRPVRVELGRPQRRVGVRPSARAPVVRRPRHLVDVDYWPVVSEMRRAVVCVRRKVRREVLFALALRGRGAGKKAKRSVDSQVRC